MQFIPVSPLNKCFVGDGEEFFVGSRRKHAGESADSSSFSNAEPCGKDPSVAKMTFSTDCYGYWDGVGASSRL